MTAFHATYAAARAGDAVAVSRLVDGIAERVRAYLAQRSGPTILRHADREDLFQSAVLTLLDRLPRFPADLDETEFLAYALQIARWHLASAAARAPRERGASQIAFEDPPLPTASTGPVTRDDDRRWLRSEIRKLDQKYAVVLMRHYVDGQDVDTIARALGLTSAAVKQRLKRGRDLMRVRRGRP